MADSIYTPSIYLFASVDIVGSTNLKYKDTHNIEWFEKFKYFYNHFPDDFKSNIKLIKNSYIGKETSPKLNIWKYAGDEILFYWNIKNENEIYLIVDSFKRTLKEWNDVNNKNQSKEKKIDLKGTMWTGQTPYIDRIVTIKGKNNYDFVGTSIDCGFRLGKYASQRHLVISIELVDICKKKDNFTIYYTKSENLKGVLGDTKYPIFVLLVPESDKHNLEEKHLLKQLSCSDLDLFFSTFYKELQSKFEDKVSRIEIPINNYLDSKLEQSKKIENDESGSPNRQEYEGTNNNIPTKHKDLQKSIDEIKNLIDFIK